MSDDNIILDHFPPIKQLVERHRDTHFVAEVKPHKNSVEFILGRRTRGSGECLAGLRIIYPK